MPSEKPAIRPLGIDTNVPALVVTVNDEEWHDVQHLEVELSANNIMGQFTLDASMSSPGECAPAEEAWTPIKADSRLGRLVNPTLNPKVVPVKIYAGLNQSLEDNVSRGNLEFLMSGIVDRVDLDRTRDHCNIVGRDQSAVLQDSFIHAQFRNRTTSDVVKEIAEGHGLKHVIERSGTLAGTVYESEGIDFESRAVAGVSEWDLLTRFAYHDGYSVFVRDDVLYYMPIEDYEETLEYVMGENVEHLTMSRDYTLGSSRIGIEIASTRLKQKDSVIAKAGSFSANSIIVREVVPGIDPETAGTLAESLQLLYTQFAFVITLHVPGHPMQSLFNRIMLQNTGTVFDGAYKIMSIQWLLGIESGWQAVMACARQFKEVDTKPLRKRQVRRRS